MKIKKLYLGLLILISTTVFADTLPATSAFTFVAPASVAVAPAMTNLLGVVNAFKSVGTAFSLVDLAATALLDEAALNLTLSIEIKNVDTLEINSPTYSPANGQITWENNFSSSVASSNAWVQTDVADYDAKGLTFRDAGGSYVVAAIMTGGSGVNYLLSAIDGAERKVNGVDYIPNASFNSYATSFNTATNLVDKVSYLGGITTALTAIQAQATAMDVAGSVAVTTLNTLVFPAAGKNSASYDTLNTLLLYNGLQ
jgi:hypothetical protein